MKNDGRGNRTARQAPDTLSTVLGVVYPPGGGGGRVAGQADWTLRFTLQPWRAEGGVLQETALSVAKNVRKDDLKRLMDRLQPYQIIQALVNVTEPGHADLIRLLSTAAQDRDLEDRAAALQLPMQHQDPLFGRLTFNRSVSWWEARISWNHQPVTLYLSVEHSADRDSVLAVARSLWNDQAVWDERIREYAVQALLDLKNDSWLDDDEQPLSAQQFLARMTLESITVDPDSTFSFMHNDGELFWGHAIQVTGSLQEGPTAADIPG